MLTQSRLKEYFNYDHETGVFTYRVSVKGSGRRAGDVAGCIADYVPAKNQQTANATPRKIMYLGIDYKIYRAHRLAWLYIYGEMPNGKIDHKNGNPLDNRIENLRIASDRMNSQNIRKAQPYNKTGVLGVGIDKARGCFKSEIRLPSGKRKFLGRFKTVDEAHQAYIKAKRIYHEGCTI